MSQRAWGRFDETKHRRHPRGTRQGGQFAPKTGAARQAAPAEENRIFADGWAKLPQDLVVRARFFDRYVEMVARGVEQARHPSPWKVPDTSVEGSSQREAVDGLARLLAEGDFRGTTEAMRRHYMSDYRRMWKVTKPGEPIEGDAAARAFLKLYRRWFFEEGQAIYGHPLRHLADIGVSWVDLPDAQIFLHWYGDGEKRQSYHPGKDETIEWWTRELGDPTENGRVYAELGMPDLDKAMQRQLLGRTHTPIMEKFVAGMGGLEALPEAYRYALMAHHAAWQHAGKELDTFERAVSAAIGNLAWLGVDADRALVEGHVARVIDALKRTHIFLEKQRHGQFLHTFTTYSTNDPLSVIEGVYALLPTHPNPKDPYRPPIRTFADISADGFRALFDLMDPLMSLSNAAAVFDFLRRTEVGPDGERLSPEGGPFRTAIPQEYVDRYFSELLRPAPYHQATAASDDTSALRPPAGAPGDVKVDESTRRALMGFLDKPEYQRRAILSTHFGVNFPQKEAAAAKQRNSRNLLDAIRARLPDLGARLTEQDTSDLIHQWAMSANSLGSLRVQEAAARLFGPRFGTHLSAWQERRLARESAAAEALYKQTHDDAFEYSPFMSEKVSFDESQALVEAAVDAMYDATQAEFARQGVKTVTLYRGLRLPRPVPFAPRDLITLDDANALESWTFQPRTAFQFANPAKGITGDAAGKHFVGMVIKAEVPVERIFATARTGFGCLGEFEALVLNSDRGDVARVEFFVNAGGSKITRPATAVTYGLMDPQIIPQHKAWTGRFDETKHRRHPRGTKRGGQFAPKFGEGSSLFASRQAAPRGAWDALQTVEDVRAFLFDTPSREVSAAARALPPDELDALVERGQPTLKDLADYANAFARASERDPAVHVPLAGLLRRLEGLAWPEISERLSAAGARLSSALPHLIEAVIDRISPYDARLLADRVWYQSGREVPALERLLHQVESTSVDSVSGQTVAVGDQQVAVVRGFEFPPLEELPQEAVRQKRAITERLAARTGLNKQSASSLLRVWAGSSNAYPASVQLQEVAARRFGLSFSDWQRQVAAAAEAKRASFGPNLIQEAFAFDAGDAPYYMAEEDPNRYLYFGEGSGMDRAEADRAIDAALADMYSETQAWFRRLGVSHVRLYRGYTLPASQAQALAAGQTIAYDSNVLSSWTLSYDVARQQFGRATEASEWRRSEPLVGVTLSALFPVEQVLCHARTGFGCLEEQEFVVIGTRGPSHARIEFVDRGSPWTDVEPVKAWLGRFDESKHRRHPRGTRMGGQFAPKTGAARQAAPVYGGELMAFVDEMAREIRTRLIEPEAFTVIDLMRRDGYRSLDDVVAVFRNRSIIAPEDIFRDVQTFYYALDALEETSLAALLEAGGGRWLDLDHFQQLPAVEKLLAAVTLDDLQAIFDDNEWQPFPWVVIRAALRNSFPALTPDVLDSVFLDLPEVAETGENTLAGRLLYDSGVHLGELWRETHYPLDRAIRFAVQAANFGADQALFAFVNYRPWAEVKAALAAARLRYADVPIGTLRTLVHAADLDGVDRAELRRLVLATRQFDPNQWPSEVADQVDEVMDYEVRSDTGAWERVPGGGPSGSPRDRVVHFFDTEHWGPPQPGLIQDAAQKKAIAQQLAPVMGLTESAASDVIHQWAVDANGPSLRAMAPHLVAAEEFDTDLSEYQRGLLANLYPERLDDPWPVPKEKVRAALRHMKRQTEQWLAQLAEHDPYYRDHPYVLLYRGVKLPKEVVDTMEVGDVIAYDDNALSSWSLSELEAGRFIRDLEPGQHGIVISALIPFDRILCNARTGYGCLHEKEFVVLGGKTPAFAEVRRIQMSSNYY